MLDHSGITSHNSRFLAPLGMTPELLEAGVALA
jgi:hypothetical protein